MNAAGGKGSETGQDGRTGSGEGEDMADERRPARTDGGKGKCGNVERRRIREKKNPGTAGV